MDRIVGSVLSAERNGCAAWARTRNQRDSPGLGSYPGVCLEDGLGAEPTRGLLAIQVSFSHAQLMHL